VTSKPAAGSRIKAANAPAPYLLSAACSAPVTVTGTAMTDIPGCSITFSTVNANASVLVTGVFDAQAVTMSGAAVATGNCAVDGTLQPGQATHDEIAVGDRGTVSQVWNVTLAAAGSHLIKLQGALSGASGSTQFNATHTTLTLLVLDW
jgi:hypothetical protein